MAAQVRTNWREACLAGWRRVEGEGGLGGKNESKPASVIFLAQRWETAGEGRSRPEVLQGREERLRAAFMLPSINLRLHV